MIVGGFYSEVALQKREAEGTVRTKHQLNLDPHYGVRTTAEKDSEESREATRRKGDDLEESAARALMRHTMGGRTWWERLRAYRRGKIEVDPKRRSLRHDMSDLALETVEESRAFGEDRVLIGLH